MTQENKHERFKRVAGKRASRILKDLQLLSNTGNRYEYSYEPEEVERIFETIEKQLRETKTHFSVKTDTAREFTL